MCPRLQHALAIAEKSGFMLQERNIAYLAIIHKNECTSCMAGHTNRRVW